jgi:hypothetical protein
MGFTGTEYILAIPAIHTHTKGYLWEIMHMLICLTTLTIFLSVHIPNLHAKYTHGSMPAWKNCKRLSEK